MYYIIKMCNFVKLNCKQILFLSYQLRLLLWSISVLKANIIYLHWYSKIDNAWNHKGRWINVSLVKITISTEGKKDWNEE